MSKSYDFKKKVLDLNKTIQELKNNFFNTYSKVNNTIEQRKRIDFKLSKLETIQNDIITLKTTDSTLSLSKQTIENCIYFNLIQSELLANPNNKEFFVDYTGDIAKVLLEIIQTFQKDKPYRETINIEVKNESKKLCIIEAIESYFPKNVGEVAKKLAFFKDNKSFGNPFGEDVIFDLKKKGDYITLNNNNKTATFLYNGGSTHQTVLGTKAFTEGVIKWRIRIDNKGISDWLCVGILEHQTKFSFADNQSAHFGINIRGGGYSCNRMTPDRIPSLENDDVLTCTLDFEENCFKIVCGDKFEVKSTVGVKGKKWYPSVLLYDLNQGVTIMD